MQHIRLQVGEFTRQRGITMKMKVAVEPKRNRAEGIAFGVLCSCHLATTPVTPTWRNQHRQLYPSARDFFGFPLIGTDDQCLTYHDNVHSHPFYPSSPKSRAYCGSNKANAGQTLLLGTTTNQRFQRYWLGKNEQMFE
jgi:hypothetical protein